MPPDAPFLPDPARPVLIAGPTASGKSALALRIAEAQGRVIINADALQVHDAWQVLSARPGPEDLGRAPHLLYGHVPRGAEYSVGHWLREVAPLLARHPNAVIVGGTAGGPDFTQGWSMFSEAGVMTAGVVVSALFTSGPVAGICRGGYGTTGRKGIATRVSGRVLHEIDGRPASEVYREWTGDLFETAMDGATDVRARSSLFPLGVEVGAVVASVPFHDLLHPARIHPDGAIEFYGDLRAGLHGTGPQARRIHRRRTAVGLRPDAVAPARRAGGAGGLTQEPASLSAGQRGKNVATLRA